MIFDSAKKPKHSFSQSGEDCIVAFIFEALKIDKPSYIDIGAHHPFIYNNTAVFYKKGSRGINVEPNPEMLSLLKKNRPKDVNLNIGIGAKKGKADFYQMSVSTLSTFSKIDAQKSADDGYQIMQKTSVGIDSLKNILNKYHQGKSPEFLSIDVEGMEKDIFNSFNFKVSHPIVICAETVHPNKSGKSKKNQSLIDLIKSKGYWVYADTYINTIFVHESKKI